MKVHSILALILFANLNLAGQQFKKPNLNFGGTKVDWLYTVEDTTEVQESDKLPYLRSETGIAWNTPIEIDGKIIYNIDNRNPYSFGNILSCYDLKSGDQKWIRHINPAFEDGYCYNFYHSLLRGGNNELILTGIRSLIKSTLTRSQGNFGGRYIRKVIELNSGKDIETYLNDRILTYKIGNVNPDLTGGKELYYNQAAVPPNSTFTERFYPYFVDIKNDTTYNINGVDTTGQLLFSTNSDGGIPNSIRIDGPFSTAKNEYTYIVQYEKNRIAYQILWQVDHEGVIIFKRDISELLRGSDNREHYLFAQQKNDRIFLTMKKNDSAVQGHRGYAILDMKGNLIKKNTSITIEGKKVGHLVTTPLKTSTDLIHAIRFQNSNDLFFYKEKSDKSYIKVGQLENTNTSAYAFIPEYVFQSSDEGLIVSGSFSLDTVTQYFGTCRFDCEGWPVIMKLSAETLGIPTSISDVWQQPNAYTITPNPTTDHITITISDGIATGSIQITDQTGRIVAVQDISTSQTIMDISALNTGLYFVTLKDQKGRRLGAVEKVVKM